MPTLKLSQLDAVEEENVVEDEGSVERFDRVAFALRAVDVVRPPRTTVVVCQARSKLRVESGVAWGRGAGERWAVVSVPPYASRQAIALAVSKLAAATAPRPYALDVLLGETLPSTT